MKVTYRVPIFAGAAEELGLIPIEATGAPAQTIVTAAPTIGTTYYNATVTPGAVTITTAAPVASTAYHNATITQAGGTQSITTAAPVPSATYYNATVTPGAVTIIAGAPTPSITYPLATVVQAGGTQTIETAAPVTSTQYFSARILQQTITIIRSGGTKKRAKKRKTYIVEEERIGSIAVEYTDTLAADLLAEIQAKAREEARKQAEGVQALIHQKTLELRAAREAARAAEEAARLAREKAERIAKRQAEAFAIWQDRQERLSMARNSLALNRKNRIIRRSERNLQIMADLHNIIEIADRYL